MTGCAFIIFVSYFHSILVSLVICSPFHPKDSFIGVLITVSMLICELKDRFMKGLEKKKEKKNYQTEQSGLSW